MAGFSDNLKDLLHNKRPDQKAEGQEISSKLQQHIEEVNKLFEEQICNDRKNGLYVIHFRIPNTYYYSRKFIIKNLTENLIKEGFCEYTGSFDDSRKIPSKSFSLTQKILFGLGGEPHEEALVLATPDFASGIILRL